MLHRSALEIFSFAKANQHEIKLMLRLTNLRIVLTGGPGGGKTNFMQELRAEDPRAEHWLLVPEAAPLLFQTGLSARNKDFQRAVVHLQIALEETCAEVAVSDQVLICHRGTLDALAYWLRNGWAEEDFFTITETNPEAHFRRYAGVIHFQTAAIDASKHYRRWPDAHRPETLVQAAETDHLCARAWRGHPHYVFIDNLNRDWHAKSEMARSLLNRWVSLKPS